MLFKTSSISSASNKNHQDYGCISFLLIASGLIFTIFSVVQKDTQIGKVWLAGPTTMVVGLVLCGKVVIDWGPAMRQQFDVRPEYEQIPGTNGIAVDRNSILYNTKIADARQSLLANAEKLFVI
ncbi:unnamed protein product [Enterobius vermicularis]|uniref:PHB domain-containing protein n=1 Tax=Enterobius vermicularis TaxID=51028 RepID=A0A0N4UVG9_ENTVE|nr:unnamed protein product [Enterobius vermicularis]